MREPAFWRARDLRSRASSPVTRLLLTPVSHLYAWAGARRLAKASPEKMGAPVVCIGNVTLGGAGKTPIAAAVRSILSAEGRRAATLSRGYGGRLRQPVCVDPETHTAVDVGDEPLMLARQGESWISGPDRRLGAAAMTSAGVQAIVMDDGHQNPSLAKDLSLVVVDASDPFGNGFVFPKGPLREPVAGGMARADAVVLMGDGAVPEAVAASGKPVFRARLSLLAPAPPGAYVAFAGIGRPGRFFDFLRSQPGITLAEELPFADHHAYSAGDLRFLDRLASERGAGLITTEKDWVRLPASFRDRVTHTPVEARFEDPDAFRDLVLKYVGAGGPQ